METDKIIKFHKVPPKVKTTQSDNFREVAQDRVFVGMREGYFIYMIQSELFDTNKQEDTNPEDIEEIRFIDEVQVRLSPQQMVKMHNVFGKLIKNYEEIHGKIKTIEQIAYENPDLMKDSSSKS